MNWLLNYSINTCSAGKGERVCSPPCFISMRQHTSAYVSIPQFTSAYFRIRQHTSVYVSIRQLTSAYVSIPVAARAAADEVPVSCQHTSAYLSIRQSIRPHTSPVAARAAADEEPVCQEWCTLTVSAYLRTYETHALKRQFLRRSS